MFYASFISQYPDSEDYAKFSEFMASEFSKPVDDSQKYNYKISSVQTKVLESKGIKSVIFPSVKAYGEEFNIAIHPNFFNLGFFSLEEVVLWKLWVANGRMKVEPIMSTRDFFDDGHFNFNRT